MSRNKNLIPIDDRPAEEARAIRAAGGRAAAKAKARNNRLRVRLEAMLSQTGASTTELIRQNFLSGDETVSTNGTYYDKMCAALVRKACGGDMKAIAMILDVLGDHEQASDVE